MRIAIALAQQTGALAQRILVGCHIAGMFGMQRRHQPVEEAPAFAGAVEEQTVELRRQPDGGDMPAKRGLARRRSAVDAHHAARQTAFVTGRLQAGADGDPSVRRIERGGDRPRGGRGIVVAGRARAMADLVEPGAAQAAAGGQEGQGLEQVRLAGTIGADQNDRLQPAVEAELAVVAEVAEAELAHGEECRRSARYGVGGVGECADGPCRHTRIGMST